MDTDQLIAQLSNDTKPLKPAASPWATAGKWLLGFAAYGAVIVTISGARPDLLFKLQSPLFLAEMAVLVAMMTACVFSAAVLSFPDMYQRQHVAYFPVFMFGLLVGVMGFAYAADAPPSPAPVNDIDCTLCIIVYATLPAGWIFYSIRKFASTHYGLAGSIAVLAAFSMGALLLRLKEQTDSIVHVVQFHYLPMILVGIVGLLLGKKLFRW